MLLSLPPLRARPVRRGRLRRADRRPRRPWTGGGGRSASTRRSSSPRRASTDVLLPTVAEVLRGGGPSSSRWGSCSRCGRGRGPSTSSSTPSQSCTARATSAGSSGSAPCRSRSTSRPGGRGGHHAAGARSVRRSSTAGCRSGSSSCGSLYWPVVVVCHDGRTHHAVPRGHPAADPLVARPARGRAGAGHLAAGLVRRPRRLSGLARRVVDLRTARRADRRAHLALCAGDRDPHRCRPQRGDPRAVAGRAGRVSPTTHMVGGRVPRWSGRRAAGEAEPAAPPAERTRGRRAAVSGPGLGHRAASDAEGVRKAS